MTVKINCAKFTESYDGNDATMVSDCSKHSPYSSDPHPPQHHQLHSSCRSELFYKQMPDANVNFADGAVLDDALCDSVISVGE